MHDHNKNNVSQCLETWQHAITICVAEYKYEHGIKPKIDINQKWTGKSPILTISATSSVDLYKYSMLNLWNNMKTKYD